MRGRVRGVARLRTQPPPPLQGRLGVVSPHCDDAVLSLGAALARHVRTGGSALVVTALAGNPYSGAPAGPWDAAAGFRTAGEATRAQRAEDAAACSRLGALYHHVDEVNEQYPRRWSADELWQAVSPVLRDCDEVLLPGYPLRHQDHRDVTCLLLRRLAPDRLVRLYVEEPYALREPAVADRAADRWAGAVTWGPLSTSGRDVRVKLRAVLAYRSQLPLLGPGRLPSPSAVAAAVTVAQLWHAVKNRGEWITGPVPARVLSRSCSTW